MNSEQNDGKRGDEERAGSMWMSMERSAPDTKSIAQSMNGYASSIHTEIEITSISPLSHPD
jgi:hypothetical protein